MHKNIVLLSDGTGNSAAKPFKTNVWRLYQALDIAETDDENTPRQIVYYDGGVGTENFKPLAALGGALGLGVWTNVKDLYTFVCRNYDVGDRIYGFGFSRGAFTIRLLMGLIGKCGVIKANPGTEAALLHAVEMAYEAFRRDFLLRASLKRRMIYHKILGKPAYDVTDDGKQAKTINLRDLKSSPVKSQIYPQIRFVGVWDTVDAYGMPVEEIKQAIDRWIWPMSFADRDLSTSVTCARHALSLDDERPTFRPVLWNEGVEGVTQDIEQVWFAGVHANVGGGYADDGLACVALDWMMTEAANTGLRYWPGSHDEVRESANPHGEQYDSRSGIASYYRYGPRQVHQLCNDREYKVHVPVVKVHDSVFDRIAAHQVRYSPVSLNCAFELVGGSRAEDLLTEFRKPEEDALLEAWRAVRSRRIAYFSTVALTIYLAWFLLPHYGFQLVAVLNWLVQPFEPIPSHVVGAVDWAWSWATIAWFWIIGLPPEFVTRAIVALVDGVSAFLSSAWTAAIALGILCWLFFKKSNELQSQIAARAEWAWAGPKGLLGVLPPPASAPVVVTGDPLEAAGVYPKKTPRFLINVLGIAILIVAAIPILVFGILRAFKAKPWLAKNALPKDGAIRAG